VIGIKLQAPPHPAALQELPFGVNQDMVQLLPGVSGGYPCAGTKNPNPKAST